MLTSQFVCSVLELWSRFRTLNGQLLESLSCVGQPGLSQLLLGRPKRGNGGDLSARLRRLQHVHLVLQRAAELLQAHVSPAVTFHLMYSVVGIIYGSYELLVVSVAQNRAERLIISPSASYSLCWLVHHLFDLVALTVSCSILEDEEVQASVLLRRAVGIEETVPQVEAFLRQIKRGPPICFTASGLLPIDRRLLVSAVSAATTYLIVLGQFGLR
ncbi:uncharacterized protein LOC124594172 [Schistocerca americana]|uniref:uncharacterized protein LOC124594172 n=1 Tax=Schistocerca americana TaxID=7009 RepID=UPI001F4FAA46|nr:uncharacterized protein LOC124594172 [Schistocerca americana]